MPRWFSREDQEREENLHLLGTESENMENTSLPALGALGDPFLIASKKKSSSDYSDVNKFQYVRTSGGYCIDSYHCISYSLKHVIFSLGFLAWAFLALTLNIVLQILDFLFTTLAWTSNFFLLAYLRPISSPERYRRWYNRVHKSALYWNWNKIDTRDIKFPENFLWGASSAAHQVEGGCTNNNWSKFEANKNRYTGLPNVRNGDKAGDACAHWDKVPEDLNLMKDFGVQAYRFSLEWSKIEPSKGMWNKDAIAHYHMEIDLYLKSGIIPMITLHHFTEPLWFHEAGGFEKEENIQDFLQFAVQMYLEFGHKVEMWNTINEIEVYANNGWLIGYFPPAKFDVRLSAIVTLNLCRAHVAVYKALKKISLEHGWASQIGVVKDIFQFDVLNWWNPFDHYLAWQMNHTFNDCILDFFRNGYFHYWVPFFVNLHYHDPTANESNDFIGLNYYSHYCVSLWQMIFHSDPFDKLGSLPREIYTDMPHVMYPEGLYRALRELSTLKLPIYVTENGIADADDSRRQLYIARYLYAMSRAIRKGCDVRGYFYWSLMDNFEWAEGYGPKFGLYEVDFKTQKRTLRDGSKILKKIIKKHAAGEYRLKPEDLAQIQAPALNRPTSDADWDEQRRSDVSTSPQLRRPTLHEF